MLAGVLWLMIAVSISVPCSCQENISSSVCYKLTNVSMRVPKTILQCRYVPRTRTCWLFWSCPIEEKVCTREIKSEVVTEQKGEWTCCAGFNTVQKANISVPKNMSCRNESCSASNTDEKFTCTPVCASECVNASCTAPDECTCDPGYVFAGNSSTECEPSCDAAPCGRNATCVAPQQCSCDDGHLFAGNSSTECEPSCHADPCYNADCIAPDTCRCHHGFDFDGNTTTQCVNRKMMELVASGADDTRDEDTVTNWIWMVSSLIGSVLLVMFIVFNQRRIRNVLSRKHGKPKHELQEYHDLTTIRTPVMIIDNDMYGEI